MTPTTIVGGQRVNPEKVRRAKELRRAMTTAELVLWQRLRANRFLGLHFWRQQIIAGFIVDFYCHAAGLVIEADGPVHERQTEYDSERDRLLIAHGFRVMRVNNDDVTRDLDGVLRRIAEACGVRP